MEKASDVTIISFAPIVNDDDNNYQIAFFGLGDDGKIYMYNVKSRNWYEYIEADLTLN